MHQTFWKSDLKSRHELAEAKEADDAKQWRDCCELVDTRDKKRCRSCGRVANPEAVGILKRAHRHHIVYRSAEGPDESWNVATLCSRCHDEEHVKRTLRVEGNADTGITLWRKDAAGVWFVSRQEIAPFQVLRD